MTKRKPIMKWQVDKIRKWCHKGEDFRVEIQGDWDHMDNPEDHPAYEWAGLDEYEWMRVARKHDFRIKEGK